MTFGVGPCFIGLSVPRRRGDCGEEVGTGTTSLPAESIEKLSFGTGRKVRGDLNVIKVHFLKGPDFT